MKSPQLRVGTKQEQTLQQVPDDRAASRCLKEAGRNTLRVASSSPSGRVPTEDPMQQVTILTLRNSSWLGPGGLRTPDSGTPNAQVARLPSVNGCVWTTGWAGSILLHHQVGAVCLPQGSNTTLMASSAAPKLGETPPGDRGDRAGGDRAQFTGGSVRSRAPMQPRPPTGHCRLPGAGWSHNLSHHGWTAILSPAPPPSWTFV